MRKHLAATAAALGLAVSLLAAPSSAAAAGVTVADVKADLTDAVKSIRAYRAAHGTLPTPTRGERMIDRRLDGKRIGYYTTNGRAWCAVAVDPRLGSTPVWYDSKTRSAYVARTIRGLERREGACYTLMLPQVRKGWKAWATSEAKNLAMALEVYYTDHGTYPRALTKATLAEITVMSPGFRVVGYRAFPDGFKVAVQKTGGGFAVYDSRNGGIVYSGTGIAPVVQRHRLVRSEATFVGEEVTAFVTKYGFYPDQIDMMLHSEVTLGWLTAPDEAPEEFKVCVQHDRGGFAVYDAVQGSIVRSAGYGTCP